MEDPCIPPDGYHPVSLLEHKYFVHGALKRKGMAGGTCGPVPVCMAEGQLWRGREFH